MQNKKTWELILKKNRALEKKATKSLYRFMIIFVAGYLIFFTSKFYLGETYKGYKVFEVGDSSIISNRQIKLELWQYDKEKSDMLVVLSIENLSLDDENRYNFQLKDKEGLVFTEVLKETDNMAIIYGKNVKRDFKEVAIEIKSKKESFDTIKLYGNNKSIDLKKSIDKEKVIKNLSKEIYLAKSNNYKDKIKELKKELDKENAKEEIARKKIEKYETSNDINKEDLISKIRYKLDEIREKKKSITKDIDDLEVKLEKLEK